MSYDDLKIMEANRFVHTIATGEVLGVTVEDALFAAEIIEAMAESARSRRWVSLAR
jgi:predicted dehydrogenase